MADKSLFNMSAAATTSPRDNLARKSAANAVHESGFATSVTTIGFSPTFSTGTSTTLVGPDL